MCKYGISVVVIVFVCICAVVTDRDLECVMKPFD